jgi:hypothetical protein
MYDPTGPMCESLANPNHPRWADPQKPTTAERLHSFDAMFAYCGTYELQEEKSRVIHRPENGLVAPLYRFGIGFEISGWKAIVSFFRREKRFPAGNRVTTRSRGNA